MLDQTTTTEEDFEVPAEGKTEIEDLEDIELPVELPEVEEPEIEVPVEDQEEVEELPELPVEEKKAVSVEAIDGYTTTVNSSVQFAIEGDDVVIDGLDGIEYNFSNGILTINVGAEATVLTVEVSNSVNTVTFDVMVNGIIK